MPHLAAQLDRLGIPYQAHAPLASHTWYGVGGNAQILVHPADEAQLATLLALAREHGQPVYLLGSGANLLVREGTLEGLVVKLDAPAFREFDFQGNKLTAAAGADLFKMVQAAARQGLAGLEGLAGVPASLGGAIRMNAGGAHGDIGSVTDSARVMLADGSTQTLTHDRVGFAYRRGLQRGIIVGATLTLTPDDPQQVRARVKEIFDAKKKAQPFAAHSAGCAFKNPTPDQPAGKLIDTAGLKGHRIGGAFVSEQHANFIAADTDGTAGQIIDLIQHAAATVADVHGIELQREVVVWPDDGPTITPDSA